MIDFFINTFNTFLYQPLFNALIFLYQTIPGQDFGIAIIILTILIKVIFYPLATMAIKSQKALAEIQPKIQKIQQKFKEDKEKQAKEIMAFYQREKVNPFAGCLPLLVQVPILIALYKVFIGGFDPNQVEKWLYHGLISYPGEVNFVFLGIIDLGYAGIASVVGIIIALLAGVAQFWQSKMLLPKFKKQQQGEGKMAQVSVMMQKQMVYLIPFFTIFILLMFPSALGLYWLVNALFSVGQQHLIIKNQNEKIKMKNDNVKLKMNKI